MTWVRRALLYVRTLRHLRPGQLLARPLRQFKRRHLRRTPHVRLKEDVTLASLVASWGPENDVTSALETAEAVCGGIFRFLGREERLDPVDWLARPVNRLWTYHLHYFDFARDLAWAWRVTRESRFAARFSELAHSWLDGTAGGRGEGWDPYPTSVRVVNWIDALVLLGDAVAEPERRRLELGVAAQVASLEGRLELDLLANHLLKNAKALVVAGVVFGGAAADRWLHRGRALLAREMLEQIGPDGGHYERSPMYHAVCLADGLEAAALLELAGTPLEAHVQSRLAKMVAATGVVCRTDGRLHLFNDSARDAAPGLERLDRLAAVARNVGVAVPSSVPRLDGELTLPDAGFRGFADVNAGDRLVIDCGAPAPAYQPGHAHAGALGYELDLDGLPVVVDSGVHGYDDDPYREYVRSTRAHNTVAIGGREQSEMWATFRVARRARIPYARHSGGVGNYRFEGGCVPYHDHHAVHHRRIERTAGGIRVTDHVTGAVGAPLTAWIHVHPALRVADGGDVLSLEADGRCFVLSCFGVDELVVFRGAVDPVQGWYCPRFGEAVPAAAIELRVTHNDGRSFGYTLERTTAT